MIKQMALSQKAQKYDSIKTAKRISGIFSQNESYVAK